MCRFVNVHRYISSEEEMVEMYDGGEGSETFGKQHKHCCMQFRKGGGGNGTMPNS